MDSFDIAILSALQHESRLTNFDLADKVGLSASQCSRRRAALEESGVIKAYQAQLCGEALGLDVTVFVHVTLATHSPGNSEKFKALIDGLDEVQEACSLTGEADYLVKLVVPDLKALSRLLSEVLVPHDSISHLKTSIVLERLKQTGALPLSYLRKQEAAKPLK